MKNRLSFVWNIPNTLSLLRLLMIPAFIVTFLNSEDKPALLYWSLGILLASGLTDLFDGWIARHFHQITDIGKLLDPIADKLTQVAVVICVAIRQPELFLLVAICVVKESLQAIGGALLLREKMIVRGAKWYGKVCTFIFYAVMAAFVLFNNMAPWVRFVLMGIVAVSMLFALYNYMREYFLIRRHFADEEENEPPADT